MMTNAADDMEVKKLLSYKKKKKQLNIEDIILAFGYSQ